MMDYAVVIPAFNAEATIVDALRSVAAQTRPPGQVIMVDDGSTDATVALARDAGIDLQIITQPNAGPGAATTAGLKLADRPVIAGLDADDMWLPEKMARQMALLEADPEVALTYCRQRSFRHGTPDDGSGAVRSGLNRSSIAFRRTVFERTGAVIDPPGRLGDMVDWLARARELGFRFSEQPEVLCLRRIITTSMTYGASAMDKRAYLDAVKRAMARRRAEATRSPE